MEIFRREEQRLGKGWFIAQVPHRLCFPAWHLPCRFTSASWFALQALNQREPALHCLLRSFWDIDVLLCSLLLTAIELLLQFFISKIIFVLLLSTMICLWSQPCFEQGHGPHNLQRSFLIWLFWSTQSWSPYFYRYIFWMILHLKFFSFLCDSVRGLSVCVCAQH